MQDASLRELLPRYRGVLLDAYGVLVDRAGLLPGAAELIGHLNQTAMPYLIVTNDASRLPETRSRWFAEQGLAIGSEQILTSGSLLAPYFAENALIGRDCCVLGPEDSVRYVSRAGGQVLLATADADLDVLVLGDEEGYPFLETVEAMITALFRRFDANRPVHLIQPNPDLVYPKGGGEFGMAVGGVGAIFETLLAERYPERVDLRFARLGKPLSPIFRAAEARLGTNALLMIGDQLVTDVQGALDYGLDAALVMTGVIDDAAQIPDFGPQPTYLLSSLSLD